MAETNPSQLAPHQWEKYFRAAHVRVEELEACKSSRAKAIKIGQLLAPNVGREIPIEVDGRAGKAVLRVQEGRSKERRYFFEVFWDSPEAGETGTSEPRKVTTKKKKKQSKGQRKQHSKQASKRSAPGKTKKTPKVQQPPLPKGGNAEDW
jgi:hypothetical protein